MSNICRYNEECLLRDAEINPFQCDSCGNVSYEWWEYGEPTGRMYKGPCDMYEPMPDVEALKALADEMEQKANGWDVTQGDVPLVHAGHLLGYADRIREALGVEE